MKASGANVARPVTLPPGCARLLTRLRAIGSATVKKNQRDRRRKGVDYGCGIACRGDDNLRTKSGQLGGECGNPLGLALKKAVFDLEVLPRDITMLAQPPIPGLHSLRIADVREKSDAVNRLLSMS